MTPNKTKGYPHHFHVLPYEKRHLADEALRRIREADGATRLQLQREMDALLPHTVLKYRCNLDHQRFGVFTYSPYAFAYRNGKMIPNHSEVYIVIWALGQDGVFYNKDAWGSIYFNPYPCGGMAEGILVEL